MEFVKTIAPLVPFITEEIYQNLTNGQIKESIHLELWPEKEKVDEKLLEKMNIVRQICSLGHAIRKEKQLKARQPLGELQIANCELKKELAILIKQELNIKKVEFVEKITEQGNWAIKKQDNIEIALNLELTSELKEEGTVREIIREIQKMRKQAGYEPIHTILIQAFGNESLNKILEKNKDFICKQVIAKSLEIKKEFDQNFDLQKQTKINEQDINFAIKKT